MSLAPTPLRVLAFAGSLRRNSYNRRLLDAAAEAAPSGISVTVHDSIADVPLFDEDLEAGTAGGPTGVTRLRAAIAAADGVLMATPEYNQSLPGVLKNTLDWLSRDDARYGAVLAGKPVAIMGATPGHWGTRLAQSQLRHALAAMGALTMTAPQLYIAEAGTGIEPGTGYADAATLKRLQRFLQGFDAWMRLLRGEHPPARET
ncbi:NAD(P)H-dependent oxidoreductase [Stenotrophomonas sp. 24(2023)]|uniref:NADPH-dependent FMN reductase n=1 Tax=Stenotrophomonas sp. 24(2023) TaxID=3068324 RepID=UPI0027E013FC|nr:NAD(P)H-dependent oxidoreductase [Stenotrophomonas sp. 24(2023)]WMJ69229.1 NAD(P)H-dependent oxidoreductase [Stenotrophomonas sp. 24(2023)]